MTGDTAERLKDLDPFDIFDTEAARLDRFFSGLGGQDWDQPSRCSGWSVRDVLAHLAGEELYNHACIRGDTAGFLSMLEDDGEGFGWEEFNQWCVRRRRDAPVNEVLSEWREQNRYTRQVMRSLGRDATLRTSVGPYPVGLQTFHYASEYATHADDVGAPVSNDELDDRMLWRVDFGLFALAESGSAAQVEKSAEQIWAYAHGKEELMSYADFVEATVGRLSPERQIAPPVAEALRCLA